jgi:hypothetical protein
MLLTSCFGFVVSLLGATLCVLAVLVVVCVPVRESACRNTKDVLYGVRILRVLFLGRRVELGLELNLECNQVV